MLDEGQLRRLSSLLKERNAVDAEIAGVIGRPAHPGHVGEFVAAQIFDIDLLESASQKGLDGHFVEGPLRGRSVNVKYTAKRDGLLNMTPDNPPDFYLVLTGPKGPPASSRGKTRPWVIDSVFLFRGPDLVRRLKERGLKNIRDATPASRDRSGMRPRYTHHTAAPTGLVKPSVT